jgi:hypothetical protein
MSGTTSKKTALGARPSRAAQPNPDDWVKQGAETAAIAQAEVAPVVLPVEKMKRLTIDIPESLHQDFKVYCARQGVKMADIVREAIEGRVKV